MPKILYILKIRHTLNFLEMKNIFVLYKIAMRIVNLTTK